MSQPPLSPKSSPVRQSNCKKWPILWKFLLRCQFDHLLLYSRLGDPVHTEQSSACSGCDVPRVDGRKHHHPVDPDRPVPDDQRPAAGRALPDAQTGHHPSDQLPGWCRAGHQGHPGAHQAAQRWRSGDKHGDMQPGQIALWSGLLVHFVYHQKILASIATVK